MSGPATTSVSNSRPSVIRCKAINSVTVMEIPVQLEPMSTATTKINLCIDLLFYQAVTSIHLNSFPWPPHLEDDGILSILSSSSWLHKGLPSVDVPTALELVAGYNDLSPSGDTWSTKTIQVVKWDGFIRGC